MESALHGQDPLSADSAVDKFSVMMLYGSGRKIRDIIVGDYELVIQLSDEAVAESRPKDHSDLGIRYTGTSDKINRLRNL
jgi:hypothetical protein